MNTRFRRAMATRAAVRAERAEEEALRFSPGKMAAQAAWYRERGDEPTAARLEAALDARHCCRCCGRQLTDPDSIARNIGPICLQKAKVPAWNE